MTNAEAIEILKHLRDDLHLQSKEYIDCFDMAISALEKQEQKKPLTVGDRIRAMTDEELATRIAAKIVCMNCPAASSVCAEICCGGKTCRKIILDWLKQEAKDNA